MYSLHRRYYDAPYCVVQQVGNVSSLLIMSELSVADGGLSKE